MHTRRCSTRTRAHVHVHAHTQRTHTHTHLAGAQQEAGGLLEDRDGPAHRALTVQGTPNLGQRLSMEQRGLERGVRLRAPGDRHTHACLVTGTHIHTHILTCLVWVCDNSAKMLGIAAHILSACPLAFSNPESHGSCAGSRVQVNARVGCCTHGRTC